MCGHSCPLQCDCHHRYCVLIVCGVLPMNTKYTALLKLMILTISPSLQNHLPGSGLFDAGGQSYRLDMSLFHGDIVSMTNHDYIPDGEIMHMTSRNPQASTCSVCVCVCVCVWCGHEYVP